MSTSTFLFHFWTFNIVAIVFLIILIFFHFKSNGYRLSRKSPLFFLAVLLYIIATLSPINYLAMYNLFSAHMIQHILLLLLIPPLLLVSFNKKYLKKITADLHFKRITLTLFYPLSAWFLGVGMMWILHIPSVLKAAHHSSFLMNLQMVLLPILGLIFVWPAFSPVSWQKLQPLPASVYLFLSCIGCTVLGILITFAPTGMFLSGLHGENTAVTEMIRLTWGISAKSDQMIGGLTMWVPACMIYLSFIVIILYRWFTFKGTEESNESLETKDIHFYE